MGAGDPSPGEPQPEGDDDISNLSLLARAEVDAILLEASAPGGASVVGVDRDDRVAPGAADAAAIVALAAAGGREGQGGAKNSDREEAEFLRALMGDIGFGEDEVASYSLEELLLLREVGVASQQQLALFFRAC